MNIRTFISLVTTIFRLITDRESSLRILCVIVDAAIFLIELRLPVVMQVAQTLQVILAEWRPPVFNWDDVIDYIYCSHPTNGLAINAEWILLLEPGT